MTNARIKTLLLATLFCAWTGLAAQTGPAMGTSGGAGTEIESPAAMQQSALQNPFFGGAPEGPAQPGVMPLSIADAINRALKYNMGILVSGQATQQARGARIRALSRLLPQVSAGASEASTQINLKAYGFPGLAGQPPILGPFGIFDARGYLDQPILVTLISF